MILVWGQTGFAMVIIGAALKGVPDEMLEAGRIDGATEWQIFRRLIVPTIWPTIVTVATTIAILTLKIYDIVTAMTGRQLQHAGHRDPHVEAGLHLLRRGSRRGPGDHPPGRRDARHLVQPPAVPRPGDLRQMR